MASEERTYTYEDGHLHVQISSFDGQVEMGFYRGPKRLVRIDTSKEAAAAIARMILEEIADDEASD